jgi:hypothetical protein
MIPRPFKCETPDLSLFVGFLRLVTSFLTFTLPASDWNKCERFFCESNELRSPQDQQAVDLVLNVEKGLGIDGTCKEVLKFIQHRCPHAVLAPLNEIDHYRDGFVSVPLHCCAATTFAAHLQDSVSGRLWEGAPKLLIVVYGGAGDVPEKCVVVFEG